MEGTSSASTVSRERSQWPNNSIFRAPAPIRSGSKSDFEPKLVSIGPYYHGREDLKFMEDFKHQCVTQLWQKQTSRVTDHRRPRRRNRSIYNVPVEPSMQGRRGVNDLPLSQFYRSAKTALTFYKHEVNHDPNELVRMLVLDSCFIIRTILALSQQVQESMAFIDVNIKDVRSDLLLLENQIPLFFIKEVYDWFFPHDTSDPKFPRFGTVLEPFICLDMPWKINHDIFIDNPDATHLLDLYWRCSLSPEMYNKLIENLYRSEGESDISDHSEEEQSTLAEIDLSNNALMVIANATELQKVAGIKFEIFKDKCYLDVTFSNGIMQMPHLKIDSRQKTLLRNLIAFENCIIPSMRTISCYMKLMDALIDSGKDVKLLQKCGVIYNTLSSHEDAAAFFNDIGNFCVIDNNAYRFSGLYNNVKEYYDSSWNRRLASLRYNYFNSPWAVISVVVAVILLILSVIDTFYAVCGYHYPKN